MDAAAGRFIVMGVSGVGKTRVAGALAQALGGAFIEGDDLQPAANRAQMAAGTPLTDDDRWPWLDRVGAALAAARPPAVAACSALRRRYRDRLRALVPGLVAIHLDAPRAIVAGRLEARRGHYMPPSLLDSQFEALEPLEPDERGVTVAAAGLLDEVLAAVAQAVAAL